MAKPENTIAFQGAPGAYSDLACRGAYPEMTTLPCRSFEVTFDAVREGKATLAMIPIENSVAGRVADIHHLLPESDLHIVAEHFQRVNHHLLGLQGLQRVLEGRIGNPATSTIGLGIDGQPISLA